MELLPKIDLLLPDIAAVTLIAMPAIMTAPITQAATIFTIMKVLGNPEKAALLTSLAKSMNLNDPPEMVHRSARSFCKKDYIKGTRS